MRGQCAIDNAFQHGRGQEGETNNSDDIGCRLAFALGKVLDGHFSVGLELSPPAATLNDCLHERAIEIDAALLPFPWINRITCPLRFRRPATVSSMASLVAGIGTMYGGSVKTMSALSPPSSC